MGSSGQVKRDLVEVSAHLSRIGYLVAECGLLSVRAGEEIIITPEGAHRGRIEARQLESVRLDGKSKTEIRPSSDLWTHLVIYREREDVGAVLFAQPPHATGFAIAGEPLEEQILPEMVLRLGHIPLIRQEGPAGMGESIKGHLGESTTFLLANRGVITVGNDAWQAAARLELVEHYARVLLLARTLGRVRELPESLLSRLVEARFTEDGGRNR